MKDFIKTCVTLAGVALWGYLNRAYGYLDGAITVTKAQLEKDSKKESDEK